MMDSLAPPHTSSSAHVASGVQPASPTDDLKALRDLWALRVAQARCDAVNAGGQIDDETMKSLERLHRLAHWEAPAAPRRRRPLLMLVAALGAVAGLLMFSRVTSTDVEMQAEVGELRLRVESAQPLTSTWRLASLAVAGAERIEGLPALDGALGSAVVTATPRRAMRLQTITSGAGEGGVARGGSLVLQPVTLPAGARIELQAIEDGSALRLSITAPGLVLRVSAQGPLQLVAAGSIPQVWHAAAPQALDLHAGSGRLDLVLEPLPSAAAASPQLRLEAPIAASDLGFIVVDPQSLAPGAQDQSLAPRHVSTLKSGTLVFQSLHGRTRMMRDGESLQWQASNGTLQALRWRGPAIEFRYAAGVQALTSGEGSNTHSLMPSWLDWLQARHGLGLLWGGALSGFGLLVAVLRWFGLRL